MEIHVFASGSSGNCCLIKFDNVNILIDLGITVPILKRRLNDIYMSLSDIDIVFITHEHYDHVKGLPHLCKEGLVKDLYITKGTFDRVAEKLKDYSPNLNIIEADKPFKICDISIMPFMTSHDASEPVGFVFVEKNKKIVYLTDSGYVDSSYYEILSEANAYILEANHDPVMLMHSKRPFILKKRILGETGHLSNEDATWLIDKLMNSHQTIWIVAHISAECNSVLEIEKAIVRNVTKPLLLTVYYATKEGLKGVHV